MSIEIPLSQVIGSGFADQSAFDRAVEDYVGARTAHSRTIGEPRPVAHPLVEAVVQRYLPPPDLMPDEDPVERFASAYTVVDDTPPPAPEPVPPTLAERKQALAMAVAVKAEAASESIWPALTRRLVTAKSMAAWKVPEDARTPEQVEAIVEFQGLQQKMAALDLRHGELEHEIHGLTEETIGAWQVPDFSV